VEVVRFGLQPILNRFAEQGWNPSLRRAAGSGEPFVTDEGHLILDLALATVDATASLAAELDCVPGVVAHGLFLNLADVVLMGRGESVVEFRRS
jgi:ribose 5-phosphate isomerase A